ncbi:MAG: hypothetical protein OXC26_02385 [Albidovulum sp.]|nr:hypothetical protein [Albidovulum sp.]
MRKAIDLELNPGAIPIERIEIDAKSRDDIPKLLRGLQQVYGDKNARAHLFELLDAHFRSETGRKAGRPDLEMWRILVLAVLKQGLGCDFDHVRELANQHMTLREMLGHGPSYLDDERYDRRFLKDNVALLSPELLREVNSLMASAGHAAAKGKPSTSY